MVLADFGAFFVVCHAASLSIVGEAKIAPSVGSVGDACDNALAETINGLFKAEVVPRRVPWRNFEAVKYATLEWVDWFNNRRLLEPIGNIPPAEAEANYYTSLEKPDMAAHLEKSASGKLAGRFSAHNGQTPYEALSDKPQCHQKCPAGLSIFPS